MISGDVGHHGRVEPGQASRTAVLVCQGRAVADGLLAVGRFSDPVADALLHPDERAAVLTARAGVAPGGWGARIEYEMLRGVAAVMAARSFSPFGGSGSFRLASTRPTSRSSLTSVAPMPWATRRGVPNRFVKAEIL